MIVPEIKQRRRLWCAGFAWVLYASGLMAAETANTVSATVTATSDYVADGVSASDSKPALQLGLDYTHASGLYAGFWGSTIDSDAAGTPDLELDYSLGYTSSITALLRVDVGVTEYTYENVDNRRDWNYLEWYVGVGWKENTTFYFYQSEDDEVWAGEQRRYILSHTQRVTENWALLAEVAHLQYESSIAEDYSAYRVGVVTEWRALELVLSYWDNNIDEGDDNTGDRFVLEVSRPFDIATW